MPQFNWPGQDQDQLRQHSNDFWGGIGNWWDQINRPLTGISVDEGKRQQIAKQGYGFSNRDQMGDLQKRSLIQGDPARAEPTQAGGNSPTDPGYIDRFLGGLRGTGGMPPQMIARPDMLGIDPSAPGESALSEEEQLMEDTIRAIQARLQTKYHDDGAYNAMIDEAFGGSLKAVDNARNSANSNYQESDKVLGGLTDGMVNIIKTEDAGNIKQTGAEYEKGVNQNYDSTIQDVQGDRQREINDRIESMKRFGLEASGMGNVGNEATQVVNNLQQEKAGALNTAKGTTAADLQLNTGRAQGQMTAGVERRSALRGDLDKILGGLDGQVAEIENAKAQARLQASQADRAAFNESQAQDTNTLETYLDDKRRKREHLDEMDLKQQSLSAKAKGSGTVWDVANERMSQKGVDSNALFKAYSDVMAENRFNSNSGQDQTAFIIHEMMKRSGNRFNNMDANEWLGIVQNYGTDKANAVL